MPRIFGCFVITLALVSSSTQEAGAQKPRTAPAQTQQHHSSGTITGIGQGQFQVTSKHKGKVRITNFVASPRMAVVTPQGQPIAGNLQQGMRVSVTYVNTAGPNGGVVHVAALVKLRLPKK